MDDQYHILIDKLWDETITDSELLELRSACANNPKLASVLTEEFRMKGMLYSLNESPENYTVLSDKVIQLAGEGHLPKKLEDQIMSAIVTESQPVPSLAPISRKLAHGSNGNHRPTSSRRKRKASRKKRGAFHVVTLISCLVLAIGGYFMMMPRSEISP